MTCKSEIEITLIAECFSETSLKGDKRQPLDLQFSLLTASNSFLTEWTT